MLSSAWQSLTGSKRGREEKKEDSDEKNVALQPLAAGSAKTGKPSPRQRRKSASTAQSNPTVPSPSMNDPLSTSYIVIHPPAPSYDQPPPPAYLPPPSPLDHPAHAPPSYADSQTQQHLQYPIASSSSFSSSTSPSSLYVAQPVQSLPHAQLPEEEKGLYNASIAQPAGAQAMGVAVPVMVAPSRMSERLMEQATRGWLALQASPHFQAGQAKVMSASPHTSHAPPHTPHPTPPPLPPTPPSPPPPPHPLSTLSPILCLLPPPHSALADKHVPPEIRDFIANPSIGKVLRHPTYLFFIYQLYRSVRAPFVGVFKLVLLNAARRALGRSATKDPQAAGKLNEDINSGLKEAIGHDFNVALSPAVCARIVENIDTEDLKKVFAWFSTTKVGNK